MRPRPVQTDRAPAAIGPYSQGMTSGGFVFTAMQIALDPATGDLVGADAPSQAVQILRNLEAIVTAAGGSLASVVKVTVYLTDLGAFGAVNTAYGEIFASSPPARSVVEVTALPKGALVAMEAIAAIERGTS